MRIFTIAATCLLAGLFVALSAPAQAQINWSVLPAGRSAAPNEAVSFYATIVNSSDQTMSCQPRFGGFFTVSGGGSGQVRFFPVDEGVIGETANGFVDIPAGGRQDYFVLLSVDRAFSGSILAPIRCTGEDMVITDLPRLPLVNDFRVNIAPGDQPDIIMIGDTVSADGVARVGETGPRGALMTVAAINIGAATEGLIVAPDMTGFALLDRDLPPSICETDAAGICLAPEAESVAIDDWAEGEVRFFAVRVRAPAGLGIPFYPDPLRLRVTVAGTGIEPDESIFATSVAMDVSAREPENFLAPIQQCATQPIGDVGYAFAREGGMIFLRDAVDGEGRVTARGYLHISRFQFESRPADYLAIRLDGDLAGGSGVLTALGIGEDGTQASDSAVDISVSANRAGGLVMSWDGAAPLSHDLGQRGRTRCVPAPRPADPDPAGGKDAVFLVNAPQLDRGGDWNVSRFGREPQTSWLGLAGFVSGWDTEQWRQDWGASPDEPDRLVAQAFREFFRSLSSSGSSLATSDIGEVMPHTARIERSIRNSPLGPDRVNGGRVLADEAASCMVIILEQNPDGETPRNDADDAVLGVFVRPGSGLSPEDCVP